MTTVFELESASVYFKNVRKRNILYRMGNVTRKKGNVNEIRALDDITLKIDSGRNIGVIGRNGAGKTTLIRLLAGIYAPDRGKITVSTASVSMLALGIGFDNNVTGYENIFLSALLQGHRKREIESKIDQIIEFSGIEEFIDCPVKTYSSGMRMRLAFSIAVQFEPEVLLIDEVLGVGDAEFSRKSSEKMKHLIEDRDRTVVICSHNLSYISDISDQVIWLDKGRVRMQGEPKTVVEAYSKETATAKI